MTFIHPTAGTRAKNTVLGGGGFEFLNYSMRPCSIIMQEEGLSPPNLFCNVTWECFHSKRSQHKITITDGSHVAAVAHCHCLFSSHLCVFRCRCFSSFYHCPSQSRTISLLCHVHSRICHTSTLSFLYLAPDTTRGKQMLNHVPNKDIMWAWSTN